jgi:hypothetical protein
MVYKKIMYDSKVHRGEHVKCGVSFSSMAHLPSITQLSLEDTGMLLEHVCIVHL